MLCLIIFYKILIINNECILKLIIYLLHILNHQTHHSLYHSAIERCNGQKDETYDVPAPDTKPVNTKLCIGHKGKMHMHLNLSCVICSRRIYACLRKFLQECLYISTINMSNDHVLSNNLIQRKVSMFIIKY